MRTRAYSRCGAATIFSKAATITTTAALRTPLMTTLRTYPIARNHDRLSGAMCGYLDAVEHVVVTGIDDEPRYSARPGGAPDNPPEDETFWVASTAGTGEQTLEWEAEDGSWSVVVMDADARRGVDAELSIGAELDPVIWVGIGLLVAGGLLAGGSALAITAGIRRRGR